MKGKLFEYALIYHPKMQKGEEQEPSKMLGVVTQVVATNEKIVQMLAVRRIPDEYADKLEQIDVVVRPF